MPSFQLLMRGTIFTLCVLNSIVSGQATAPTGADVTELRVSGTVVSLSKNSLIVRTATEAHQLFVIDSDTIMPQAIQQGATVTVVSIPTHEAGTLLARHIVFGAPAADKPSEKSTDSADQSSTAPPSGAPIPASVRRLQKDIEKEARRFGIGFRTGIGMDPEVLLVGVHGRMGPVFNRNITLRPNLEFGFGEVTKLFVVNLDTAYRLPLTPQWSKWGAYVGGGPSLGFTHQNFDRAEEGIDFGDLDYAAGLNLFTGIESRKGFFIETKATLWASPNPVFRVIFGWTF